MVIKYFGLVFCFIFFTNSKCRKEKDNCHSVIIFINNSNQEIILAQKFYDPSNNCVLSGSVLKQKENYEHETKDCWENKVSNQHPYELFIVDPNKYNPTNVFYGCDSIEIKNKVFKHYVLTLDDLKNNNFTINYP